MKFWLEPKTKKLNKKKIIITSLILILIVFMVTIYIVYINNQKVREYIDTKILNKEIYENGAIVLEINELDESTVIGMNNKIGTLKNSEFIIYNSAGNKISDLKILISDCIYDQKNRFLVLAEKNGKKIYLIENEKIKWEAETDGNIQNVYLNTNGYVAITTTGTSHKTVIGMFDLEGKLMFNSYLSTTTVIDISISSDNKYIAFAEIDTSGAVITSNIKVLSVQKIEDNISDCIEKTYIIENGKLITDIEYVGKDRITVMCTDSISIFENGKESKIPELKDKKVVFQSINIREAAIILEEKSTGIFSADSVVNIINTNTLENKEYTLEDTIKKIYTKDDIVAVNTGTKIEFITTNGWLAKRYIATKELSNIVLGEDIAAIIYRDRIEIISL